MFKVQANRQFQYDILKCNNLFDVDGNNPLIEDIGGGRAFFVIDKNVMRLYRHKIERFIGGFGSRVEFCITTAGDENKNIDAYIEVLKMLSKFDLTRDLDPVIGIGGGVTTDLSGLVAATYRRGVPHIAVPTTLLGYVDASVGVKNSINFNGLKNRRGTFAPPRQVILDKSFFSTLQQSQISEGMGEIVKLALILNRDLFKMLEEHGEKAIVERFQGGDSDAILDQSIKTMIDELQPNLFEQDLKRSVDFGHTFSPMIEARSRYLIGHGLAVAIDCFYSCCISAYRGYIDRAKLDRIYALFQKLKLPFFHPTLELPYLVESLAERTLHRGNRQNVPVPIDIGKSAFLNDIKADDLTSALNILREYVDQPEHA